MKCIGMFVDCNKEFESIEGEHPIFQKLYAYGIKVQID